VGEIESPSNWSASRLSETFDDNDELLRTCIFKWAFNVKPDLAVQTPQGRVLVVEAKWVSVEGTYPSASLEKEILNTRGLPRVSQTQVQRFFARGHVSVPRTKKHSGIRPWPDCDVGPGHLGVGPVGCSWPDPGLV